MVADYKARWLREWLAKATPAEVAALGPETRKVYAEIGVHLPERDKTARCELGCS